MRWEDGTPRSSPRSHAPRRPGLPAVVTPLSQMVGSRAHERHLRRAPQSRPAEMKDQARPRPSARDISEKIRRQIIGDGSSPPSGRPDRTRDAPAEDSVRPLGGGVPS
ncbi:MAG: hypothetical protein ACLSVD_08845 [Eggerthellaceae bacterium]